MPESSSGSGILNIIVLVTDNASSSFDHVGFAAGAGNDNGYNTDEGIVIGGQWHRCLDRRVAAIASRLLLRGARDGVQVSGLTTGRATISGNVFDDLRRLLLCR